MIARNSIVGENEQMPSKEQSVREAQKEYFLRKSEERIRSLKEKGADDVAVSKDPQVKRYKAKIK
ncbi:MAG: hypothetical protein ACPL7J_12420, partial [Desulfomonilaceae bacterium]